MLAEYVSLYSKFNLFYLGFFGVTLVINPSLHAGDGPFTNPMAYWTTLDEPTIFAFRFLGIAFLGLVLGPKLFGIKEGSFVLQSTFLAAASFFLFLYYGMFAPIDTAIPKMWKAQCYLSGLILGWGIVSMYTPLTFSLLPKYYLRFVTAFFCFFGVSLMIAPSYFFGPGSPSGMAYWTMWGEIAEMTGRSLGVTILALVGMGFCYLKESTFLTIINVFNLINVALFAYPAYTDWAGTSVIKMWEIQCAMQVPILFVGLNLGMPKLSFNFGLPKTCALNTETYCFANLVFFAPFVLGFVTVPDMLFGASCTMCPMPMFLEEFNDTALWNGKAWAIGIGLTVLGPYVFDVPFSTTAKQLMLGYAFNCGLFIYYLMNTEIMNIMMVGPMTGLNFLFLIWNIKVVYENDKNGSDKLFSMV